MPINNTYTIKYEKIIVSPVAALFSAALFVGCEKEKENVNPDPEPDPVLPRQDVRGQWKILSCDYYYDDELLAMHDSVIGIWLGERSGDVVFFVNHGILNFFTDSTGAVTHVGEYESDSIGFKYTLVADTVRITLDLTTVALDLVRDDYDTLISSGVTENVYGWNSRADYSWDKTPNGFDGKGNHKLETVTKYIRIL